MIEDESYEAESGMTWTEWINSSYNADGYAKIINDFVYVYDVPLYGNNFVSANDLIDLGVSYWPQ